MGVLYARVCVRVRVFSLPVRIAFIRVCVWCVCVSVCLVFATCVCNMCVIDYMCLKCVCKCDSCHPIASERQSTPFGTCGHASRGYVDKRKVSTGVFFFMPPSFCGVSFNFNRQKDSAVSSPLPPLAVSSQILHTL